MKVIFLSFIFFITLFLSSCQDIFMADLSAKEVILLAPADQVSMDDAELTFWWEEVEGAEFYKLQVVSPSFEATQKLLLDTLLQGNQFIKTLYPDTFAWRVKAINSGSESAFFSAQFYVNSLTNLLPVILESPIDQLYTNAENLRFTWQKHPESVNYRFELKKNQQDYIYPLLLSHSTSQLNFPDLAQNLRSLEEGSYQWQMRAEQSNLVSVFSSRTFTIDRSAPDIPGLVFPLNKESLKINEGDELELRWTDNSDDGAPIIDSLFVFKDSINGTLIFKHARSEKSFAFKADSCTYFWKVKSHDLAGNTSDFSPLFQFDVKFNEK